MHEPRWLAPAGMTARPQITVDAAVGHGSAGALSGGSAGRARHATRPERVAGSPGGPLCRRAWTHRWRAGPRTKRAAGQLPSQAAACRVHHEPTPPTAATEPGRDPRRTAL